MIYLDIAEWVDEQILSQEQDDIAGRGRAAGAPVNQGASSSPSSGAAKDAAQADVQKKSVPEPGAPFKLSIMPRGGRSRGSVTALPKNPIEAESGKPQPPKDAPGKPKK